MRCLAIILLAVSVGSSVKAQSQADPSQVSGATPTSNIPASSSERFRSDDVVGISVYDAPQLTGNVRVKSGPRGSLRTGLKAPSRRPWSMST